MFKHHSKSVVYVRSSLAPFFVISCLMTYYIMIEDYIVHTSLRNPVFLRKTFYSHDMYRVQCHIREYIWSIHEDYQGDNFVAQIKRK